MPRVYVNPGGEAFKIALNSKIYVDKTMIIEELNSLVNAENRFVCMSRPRRFGKSYVGQLISAYYSRGCDTRDLFDGLKLSEAPSFEKYLNKLDVIRIDLNGFYSKFPKERDHLMDVIVREIVPELREVFPDVEMEDNTSLAALVTNIYQQTQHRFVIFIDEYDVLIREKVPAEEFTAYLTFLNAMFKDLATQEAIALAYITGILPIIRDKVQSKLNIFREYNFLSPGQFTEFMGYTEEETRQLCERYSMSYEETKLWYDGYQFRNGTSVLAPMSVNEAMLRQEFADYWSQTSTFMAVTDVMKYSKINMQQQILDLVAGEEVRVDVTTYRNTMTDFDTADDVLTFCILLGYLGYNAKRKRCYIPNAEVRKQWEHIAARMESTSIVGKLLKESEELLQATIDGKAADVAKGLELAHDAVATIKGYNDENAFQAAISYAYYYAQNAYTIIKELPTGKGFADVVFIPKYPTLGYPAFVIELKVKDSTNTAMDQIKTKKYGSDLLHYKGDMLLVAVSYDRETKEHTCEIERKAP